MRLKQIIPMLALVSLMSGCTHRLFWLEITSDKQVLEGYDEDQALRDQVATLVKGPAVKGQTCSWFTMGTAGMDATRRLAYVDAMDKAGALYDALVDVRQTSVSYPPLPLYCVSLEGTAVKSETQYAQMHTSAMRAKPKGKVHSPAGRDSR